MTVSLSCADARADADSNRGSPQEALLLCLLPTSLLDREPLRAGTLSDLDLRVQSN